MLKIDWPLVVVFCAVLIGVYSTVCLDRQNKIHRSNAMDLCAWHARSMQGDVTSDEATALWRDIIRGDAVCPFCGQKHDGNWVSRNAWDSQVNAKWGTVAK
jgi:hypothetical protein